MIVFGVLCQRKEDGKTKGGDVHRLLSRCCNTIGLGNLCFFKAFIA